MVNQYIALNRFGTGVSLKKLNLMTSSPKQHLLKQLEASPPIEIPASLPTFKKLASDYKQYASSKKQAKSTLISTKDLKKKINSTSPRDVVSLFSGKMLRQSIHSNNDLNWRLLDFFSNHFSVTGNGRLMKYLMGTIETEAIAPHFLGQFEELLLAVCKHPVMLLYLNNERSFGPNSKVVKRKNKFGLNENLAREILELHTLGVSGGYTQLDVTELAKAITGWSLNQKPEHGEIGFKYRHNAHEPGSRKVLGKVYPAGKKQGEKILRDLARHPATAKFVCTKLVTHFISDTPDPKLISLLEKTWLKTNGNIKSVIQTLITSELSWTDTRAKFKSPREFLRSALSLIDFQPKRDRDFIFWLTELGQRPFAAGSPAGYPDTEIEWSSPNALMARVDWVNAIARKVKVNIDLLLSINQITKDSSETFKQVKRAESKTQALMLLLLSPEFMRR